MNFEAARDEQKDVICKLRKQDILFEILETSKFFEPEIHQMISKHVGCWFSRDMKIVSCFHRIISTSLNEKEYPKDRGCRVRRR